MAVTGPETFAMMAGARAAMTDENRDEATKKNTRCVRRLDRSKTEDEGQKERGRENEK